MPADDGKMRLTDVATAETLAAAGAVRSQPQSRTHKALAGKGWLRAHARACRPQPRSWTAPVKIWLKHGRSEKWIQQRMMGQETRNKLTDYEHDIKEGEEFAILTNIIHPA
jgi:hypothetical protein